MESQRSHPRLGKSDAKQKWQEFYMHVRHEKLIKTFSRQQNLFRQRRREGLARVWSIFGKKLESINRKQLIEEAGHNCAERRINKLSHPRKGLTQRQRQWRNWHSMRTGLVYPAKRKAFLQGSRRVTQWKKWFNLVRGVNISRWLNEWLQLLTEKKELAYEVAVDYVNDLIGERGPHITDLSEIDGASGKRIPIAESEDEVVALFVNQLLESCRIPIEEEEEEEEEEESVSFGQTELEDTLAGIDMNPALLSFTTPNIRHMRTMTEKDITLYVNDRNVYAILDYIFSNTDLPICRNSVPDNLMRKAVEHDVFDDVHEFSGLNIESLLHWSIADANKYATDPVLYDICRDIYMNIDLPIVPNDVDEEAARMIADETLLGEMGDLFRPVDFGHLRDYEEKDMQLYVNERTIDRILDEQREKIELPLEPNVASEETIREITEKDYSEWIPPFSELGLAPLLRCPLSISFDKGVVDDLVASLAFDEIADLPLEPNTADEETINEIVAFDDFEDALYEVPEIDEQALRRYKIKDVRVHTAPQFIEALMTQLYRNEELPIVPNTPTKEMLDDILTFEDFTDVMGPISLLHCDCLSVQPNDIRRYVNGPAIDSVIDMILGKIDLPIIENTFDESLVGEILNYNLFDSMDRVLEVDRRSLERYQFKDLDYYVNNKSADAIASAIFSQVTLPIVPNQVTEKTIDEILAGDDYEDIVALFDDVDIWPLHCIDPLERRINFLFPITAQDYLESVLENLPIISNTCTKQTLEEITSIFDEVDFFDFQLEAVRPIQEYHAPPEVFENINDVVERLLDRILRRDILPKMPFKREIIIEDEVLADITSDILREHATLLQLAPSRTNPLVSLQPNEIPSTVMPEDVVQQLLWGSVLPSLPLIPAGQRMARFQETMDDSVF